MKNAAFVVLILVGLTYTVKLGYEIEFSHHSRAERGKWFPVVSSSATQAKPKDDPDPFAAPIVPPPSNHPPLNIIAGAHNWHVLYTTKRYLDAGDAYAFSSSTTREIWLSNEQSLVEAKTSLVHELLHAAKAESDTTPSETWGPDEKFINPTAPVFAQILHDNPALLKWLSR